MRWMMLLRIRVATATATALNRFGALGLFLTLLALGLDFTSNNLFWWYWLAYKKHESISLSLINTIYNSSVLLPEQVVG